MQCFRAAFEKLQEMLRGQTLIHLEKKSSPKLVIVYPVNFLRILDEGWAVASQNVLLRQRLFEVLLNSLTFAKHKKANTERLFKH